MIEALGHNNPPVIPNAGVYGAESAAATNAYNNAVAAATSQRNALYHSYGLNEQGSVDPNNPGGQYQMMLKGQDDQFRQDRFNSAHRGLSGGGLANQAEGHDRDADIGQDFQFQSAVAGVGSDYQNTLQQAGTTRDDAITAAYNDAMNKALSDQLSAMGSGYYDAPGTGESYPGGTAGDGSDLSKRLATAIAKKKIPAKHPPKKRRR